jgi:HAD superfamily hydrolase (TIGR01509 family)
MTIEVTAGGCLIEAVVFDMDGVLIDSHPVHRAAWRDFLRSIGNQVSEEDLGFILEGGTRADILRHFLGQLSECDLQQYGKRKDEMFRRREHEIEAIPGVVDFLRQLDRAGVRKAIATSASEIRTFATIERMGLSDCFEVVITASDVGAGKPDPEVYRLACERLEASPGRSLAFDDAPAGIMAACSARMRSIGVAQNGMAERLLKSGAERVIPNFLGLGLESLAAPGARVPPVTC